MPEEDGRCCGVDSHPGDCHGADPWETAVLEMIRSRPGIRKASFPKPGLEITDQLENHFPERNFNHQNERQMTVDGQIVDR